jgi:hypothetical protein
VAFLKLGSYNGCENGGQIAIANKANNHGFSWQNRIIAAHDFSHALGANEYGHGRKPDYWEQVSSCFTFRWASYMNYCDAYSGSTKLDPDNRDRIRSHFEKGGI